MKPKIIAGNWKNKVPYGISVRGYVNSVAKTCSNSNNSVILCPHFLAIQEIAKMCKDKLFVGAQNVHYSDDRTCTGEIPASVLHDYGASYVLIGHSERRHYFKEQNIDIVEKLISSIKYGLKPILCVGEEQQQHKAHITSEIISLQVKYGLSVVNAEQAKDLIIAYEPVWSIGSGNIPTYDNINNVITLIRNIIDSVYENGLSDNIYVLYGGSVNDKNAAALIQNTCIDGFLVGGASLQIDSFKEIIQATHV